MSTTAIPCGGAQLFPLPPGPSCAARARGLLGSAICDLGLSEELGEDGALAVSELVTNAHLHAVSDDTSTPANGNTGAELWIWAATLPRPQLVVSVFDTDRTTMPRRGPADLLAESGKGLAIVDALAFAWGAHPTRSRLKPTALTGKRVWFSMELPRPWPWTLRVVSASLASKRLLDLLRVRGIETTRTCDGKGIALIRAGHLNVWVEPRSFTWCDPSGHYVRVPHLDLQEAVEGVISAIEHRPARHPATPRAPQNAARDDAGRFGVVRPMPGPGQGTARTAPPRP